MGGISYLGPAGAITAAAAAVLVGNEAEGALSTFLLLFLVAWLIPAGVALVARVVLTKVIHLSRLLAEEEGDEEEEEGGGEGRVERAGRREGRRWGGGAAAARS